ncbi:hypothetical protein [Phenylobacterium sp.]|uniref:hypothetical protein n=1 Tax=Phenylobacterium sp. TaxID=1871053 RepID=UPI003782E875
MSAARKAATVAAVGLAIASPIAQAVSGWGLDQAEFAAQGDSTLRAAGWAFSIWTLIYAGLLAYAAYQSRTDRPVARALGWPAAAAIAGCGLWIWASAADVRWATVAIIVASAAAAVTAVLRARDRAEDLKDRLLALWPLALLAGWLTIASAVNILTVLTAEGLVGDASRPAAYAGVAAVLLAALAMLRAGASSVYAIPVAWGLIGVWAGERADKPAVAASAVAAAVVIVAYGAWRARPRRQVAI